MHKEKKTRRPEGHFARKFMKGEKPGSPARHKRQWEWDWMDEGDNVRRCWVFGPKNTQLPTTPKALSIARL
jgi:hypothetical protein